MFDLDIGGACPRRPLGFALLEAMGAPTEPGSGTGAFSVGTLDYPSPEGFELLARAMIRARQDSVFAMFADAQTNRCGGLALIYRTNEGATILEVEPCRLKRQRPMILVTRDRSQAFQLDERGIVTARPVPPKGVARRST